MEEQAMDHGAERLPFFAVLALLFLFSPCAWATTFGPINVADQIRKSQYFLHGKITQGPWAEMERRLGRPFTHWKLQISEQFTGPSLGAEVIIRQPGGEIGEMGYRVAGSANFSVGEEVFVTVRETDEPGIKEVVGLSSGKYKVDKTNGEKIQNGIGFPVQVNGKNLSAKEFSQLATRISKGIETESDKNIILNQNFSQDHDPVLDAAVKEALDAKTKNNPTTEAVQSAKNTEESHQEALPSTEESKDSGVWKLPVLIALFVFLAGVVIILRKNK